MVVARTKEFIMAEDRIVSEFTFAYKAKNTAGVTTIELSPTTLVVRDQSPESASTHLISVVQGILTPAVNQSKA
jgi:hypothetical protein